MFLYCLMAYCAQIDARLVFRTFDVKSGISDNYVLSILRDQYGFMWFGTINGLNRYDGYQCNGTLLLNWEPTITVSIL